MRYLGLFWLLIWAVFDMADSAPVSDDPDSANAFVGKPGRGGRRVGGMSGGPSSGGSYQTPKETVDYLKNLQRYDKLMKQYRDIYSDEAEREAAVLKKLRITDDEMFRGLKVYKAGEVVEPWPSQRKETVRGLQRNRIVTTETTDSGSGTEVSLLDVPTTAVSEEVVELRKNPSQTEEIPSTEKADSEPRARLPRPNDHRRPLQKPIRPPKTLLGKKLQEALDKAQYSSKMPMQSNFISTVSRSGRDLVAAAKSNLRVAGTEFNGPLPEEILRSLQHSAAMAVREMGLTTSPRPLLFP